ncbi:MAG: histidine kinase N-terminal 7TM domain-containing protein [Parcubacteria group bacterium]
MTLALETNTIILWVLAAFELLLTLYIFFRYQKTQSIYALCGMLFGFTLMSFFVGFLMTSISSSTKLFIAESAFYAGAASFVCLFAFALYYPLPTVLRSSLRRISIFGSLLLLIPIVYNHHFLNQVDVNGGTIHVEPGALFWLFILFSVAFYLASIVVLIRKAKHAAPQQKHQVMLVTVIIGITGLLGLVADRLLPVLGVSLNMAYTPIAAACVAVLVAVIALG